VHSGKAQDGPSHGGKSTKSPRERGQELKASHPFTTKERTKIVIQNLKVFY